MSKLWIVHRAANQRYALARLLPRGAEPELGGAATEDFESKPEPAAVVLGVEGDFDLELHFADRFAAVHPEAHWIIVGESADLAEARRLFSGLSAEFVGLPGERERLRRAVSAALLRRRVDPLRERSMRRVVWARFDRWFDDLKHRIPDLLRAADPAREGVPMLVRGEPGTGRSLLSQYVHHHYLHDAGRAGGARSEGTHLRIACAGLSPGEIAETLYTRMEPLSAQQKLTLCLDEVDRARVDVQRELRDWIETGLPSRLCVAATRLRFVGVASDEGASPEPGLDPGLEQLLSALSVRIPPLRERTDAIPRFVDATVRAWCEPRRQRRSFTPDAIAALGGEVWPGNLRELETVVIRTLASSEAAEIRPDQLRFEASEPPARRAPRPAASPAPAAPAPEPLAEAPPLPVAAEGQTEPSAAPDAPPAAPGDLAADAVKRLIRSIEHEVRNPLVSIATLVKLLHERHADPEFRDRFARIAGGDVRRIERVVERLRQLATLSTPERRPVDVSAFLEEILEGQRDRIERQRLVVLKELESPGGVCLGDAQQLRLGLEGLIDKAFELVPERGDVYLASKRHDDALRVLIRFQSDDAQAGGGDELSPSRLALDVLIAEAIVKAAGGSLSISGSGGRDTVIVLDLPAPPER